MYDINILFIKYGKTCLYIACYHGRLEIIKILLQYNCDLSINKDKVIPIIQYYFDILPLNDLLLLKYNVSYFYSYYLISILLE